MKRIFAAVGVVAFMTVGSANAAVATLDFEGLTDGDTALASFASALTPLGVTFTSTVSGGTGGVDGRVCQWRHSGRFVR